MSNNDKDAKKSIKKSKEIKKLVFDYYYGTESLQFLFYRLPKVLFSNKNLKVISTDSKVLYSFMLERMGLSVRNNWVDGDGKVFIRFSNVDVQNELDCSKPTALKLLKELDDIGLIERKKMGKGKSDRIYVKNFITGIKDCVYTKSNNSKGKNAPLLKNSDAYDDNIENGKVVNKFYHLQNEECSDLGGCEGYDDEKVVNNFDHFEVEEEIISDDFYNENDKKAVKNFDHFEENSDNEVVKNFDLSGKESLPEVVKNFDLSGKESLPEVVKNFDLSGKESLPEVVKNFDPNNKYINNTKYNNTNFKSNLIKSNQKEQEEKKIGLDTIGLEHSESDFNFSENQNSNGVDIYAEIKKIALQRSMLKKAELSKIVRDEFSEEETLPYLYTQTAMYKSLREAIHLITNYDKAMKFSEIKEGLTFEQRELRELNFVTVKIFNEALINLLSTDGMFSVGNVSITSGKVYDKLIEHIKFQKLLYVDKEFGSDFEFNIDLLMENSIENYNYANENNNSGIKYPIRYMMRCILSAMEDGNSKRFFGNNTY